MAGYGIINNFKGGTKEQYEAVVSVVHPDGGESLPAGQTLHLAGPTQDGWAVVAIWDDEATWTTFRDNVLMPGFAKAEGGFEAPPDEISFDVERHLS